MTPSLNNARYIVMLLDNKHKQHDGKVFVKHQDARDFANSYITDGYCTKAVIGFFVYDSQRQEMLISHVETIGYRGDKKHVNQMDLFKGA